MNFQLILINWFCLDVGSNLRGVQTVKAFKANLISFLLRSENPLRQRVLNFGELLIQLEKTSNNCLQIYYSWHNMTLRSL